MWYIAEEMARRRRPTPSASVVRAREDGKAARTFARWDGAKRVVPAVAASAAAVGVAAVQPPASALNYVLATVLAIVIPAALAKIAWDGHQKKRLRGRVSELEQANRTLMSEADAYRQLPPPSSSP